MPFEYREPQKKKKSKKPPKKENEENNMSTKVVGLRVTGDLHSSVSFPQELFGALGMLVNHLISKVSRDEFEEIIDNNDLGFRMVRTITNNHIAKPKGQSNKVLTQQEFSDLYYCYTSSRSKYQRTHDKYVEKTGDDFEQTPEKFPPSVRSVWNAKKSLDKLKELL